MQTADQKKDIIAKLEPGDIINVCGNSLFDKAIRLLTREAVNHSAIYIGNNLLLEAVSIIAIQHVNEYVLDDNATISCNKVKNVTAAQKQQAVDWAVANLATGIYYGLNGLFGIAFRMIIQNYWWRLAPLFKWPSRNPLAPGHNFWCSETVGLIYQQIGVKFTDQDITWLTPGEIYNSSACTKVN